ncbi:MAG: DUF2383 domain-containing protein [Verrucomicrobiales bacterium]
MKSQLPETYGIACDRFDGSQKEALEAIRAEHLRSVDLLKDHIKWLGFKPDQDSGVWGGFAKTIQSGATMLGDSAALAVLSEGEEYGLTEYHNAVADEKVMQPTRDLLCDLIRPINSHLERLERMRELN